MLNPKGYGSFFWKDGEVGTAVGVLSLSEHSVHATLLPQGPVEMAQQQCSCAVHMSVLAVLFEALIFIFHHTLLALVRIQSEQHIYDTRN